MLRDFFNHSIPEVFLHAVLVIALLITGCSSAGVTSGKSSVISVKKVAIIPFTSGDNLKKDISSEAESRFRKALEGHKYKIIDRDKVKSVLRDKASLKNGFTVAEIKKIGERLGADAVITGEITELSEYQKDSRNYNSFIYGSQIFADDGEKNYEVMAFPYLKFQIIVTLVFVSGEPDAVKIENPENEVKKDISIPQYSSLDSYYNMVLDKLTDELIKNLEEYR